MTLLKKSWDSICRYSAGFMLFEQSATTRKLLIKIIRKTPSGINHSFLIIGPGYEMISAENP